MTRKPMLAALLAIALAASGCGGSSKTTTTRGATTAAAESMPAIPSSTPTGKPLTHSQWVAAGDAICARLNTELSATVVKRMSEFAQALPQAVIYERAALRQLAVLTPPRADAAGWHAFLLNAKQWIEGSAKVAVEAQASNFSLSGPAVQQARAHHEQMAKISQRSGFKQCSQV